MGRYILNPAHSSAFIPGLKRVRPGVIIMGDYDKYVPGVLVKIEEDDPNRVYVIPVTPPIVIEAAVLEAAITAEIDKEILDSLHDAKMAESNKESLQDSLPTEVVEIVDRAVQPEEQEKPGKKFAIKKKVPKNEL